MADGICPNCRRTLSENARFCIECGSRTDILVNRKELGTASSEDGVGLKINRKEPVSNPFCTGYNHLREKILNPNLAPLPEKKKFLFKSWENIKNESGEQIEHQEKEAFAAQSRVEHQIDVRESFDQAENLEKPVSVVGEKESEEKKRSAAAVEEKSETAESGIVSEQSGEESFTVEVQDNPTAFEAMKELSTEALTNGATEREQKEAEESVENSDFTANKDCNEILERADACSDGMILGETEESDTVSFEELGSEYQNSESNLKDVTEVIDEQSEHDEESDVNETIISITEPETEEDLVALQEEPTEFESLKELFSENASKSEDEPFEEGNASEAVEDNIGERPQEQVDMEVPGKASEQKPNRIITSAVGGGFRRKSPQAEQLKEISALFGKKNRN